MSEKSIAEILVETLIAAGVKRVYGVVGDSLNAFLDFDTPAQILSHLMIGAEGTLGFIAAAVLETIPDTPGDLR